MGGKSENRVGHERDETDRTENDVRITIDDAFGDADDTAVTIIDHDDNHIDTIRVPVGETIFVTAGYGASVDVEVCELQEDDP